MTFSQLTRSADRGAENADAARALIQRHGLGAALAEAVPADLPADLARDLTAEAALHARAAFVRTEALARLRDFFRAQGIDAVFLKGAVTAPLLHATLAGRAMRDVDVWIHPEHEARRAQRALREAGWPLSRELPPGHHHLDPLLDLSRALTIEIHTNLAAPALAPAALDLLWSRRVPGEFLPRLDDTGLLLHQVLHALNDPLDGPLLRDLAEIRALHGRLSPAQREEAASLAARLGRAEELRQTLALALDEPPPHGKEIPPVRLARTRLARELPVTRRGRLMRHLDRLALEVWQADSGRTWRTCRLIAEARLLGSLPGQLAGKLRSALAPRFQRMEGVTLAIGEGTLLHDHETGAVHLLNETAARLLGAAGRPVPRSALRAAVPDLPAAAFNQALRTLVDGGVLRRL